MLCLHLPKVICRYDSKSPHHSTMRQSISVSVVTSTGQSLKQTKPMIFICYLLKLRRHGMLAMSYSMRLTTSFRMNYQSPIEYANVVVRSIMCMMKATTSQKRWLSVPAVNHLRMLVMTSTLPSKMLSMNGVRRWTSCKVSELMRK